MVIAGGVGLLVKMLVQQDEGVQEAAVHALSVVTTSNDYNCRSVFILFNFLYQPSERSDHWRI